MGDKKKCTITEDGAGDTIECPKKPPPYKDRVVFDPLSSDEYLKVRAKCENSCGVKPTRDVFWNCERRVYLKRDYTAETCDEEFVELMEAIDKCVVKEKGFLKMA